MKRTYQLMVLAVLTCCCFALLACGGDDDGPVPPANNNNPNDGNKNSTQFTFQLMQDCPTCNGSTQCIDCNGTGKGCKTCQGTGKYCKTCRGNGICSDCDGLGICVFCDGKGNSKCDLCYGNGMCKYCHGKGYITNPNFPCNWCDGNKYCSKCNGSGTEECLYCYGGGNCLGCNGTKICQTCQGNPKCQTCGGDGHCSTCINSDGKCKDCTGTGKVSAQSLSFTDGSDNKRIFVHSTGDWQVSSDVEWLTFSRSSGSGDYTLTITAAKNNSVSTRSGIITFTYGDSKTNVSVLQSGESANLSVDASSVFVSSSGSGATINITSNTSWTVKAADSWVTCTPSNGTGNASVSVGASAYNGTRYSKLTVADTSGELSFEISVAQAESVNALTALRSWLEKPMGIVDVNMKTSSYQTIKSVIGRSYKINESSDYFMVYASENPDLGSLTYQGLQFTAAQIGKLPSGRKNVIYSFKIDKSTALNNYKSYLNNIIEDFKYNLNISLESFSDTRYKAYGTEFYYHEVSVDAYSDHYSFSIYTVY